MPLAHRYPISVDSQLHGVTLATEIRAPPPCFPDQDLYAVTVVT
jgi:hypothetical protein